MEKIPLQIKLKKEAYRKIALAQDLIVKEVYKVITKAVLHGGTAIWRCYSGKRFSEDLDFYFPKEKEKIEQLFGNLKKVGFEIKKKKISENSVYSELELDRIIVRLEATFQRIEGIIYDYELAEGNFISIYSLAPKQFLIEKINTYLKRFKVRDLWDIFFLLKFEENLQEIAELGLLIKNYRQPIDEQELKTILLEGITPSAEEMLTYIQQKWERKNI